MLEILYSYTNINFTEKQKEDPAKLYDLVVSGGLIKLVLQAIPEEEYNILETTYIAMNRAINGLNVNDNYNDCGIMIYDLKSQNVHSGGSGCGCIASVFSGYYYKLLKEKNIANICMI